MQVNPSIQQKTLVLRLSSLGDVILSSAVLESGGIERVVDWVVAREFAPVLRGHPAIARLWEFDRASGLRGWIDLCRQLADQDYDEVLDLHGSLRTRVARSYFIFRRAGSHWRKLPKGRLRLYGLYLFKKKWPQSWRPMAQVQRFAKFAGGSGLERPNLTHLVSAEALPLELKTQSEGPYFCVMPGSRWAGKCWAPGKFLEVCRATPRLLPVIMGSTRDEGSVKLVKLLEESGIAHVSGVGKWDLKQAAQVLAGSQAYLGNDTGLAHLAEALGVPALVIFGPTSPEMGFGPWREPSVSLGLKGLSCRPCGKDGRRCYRLTKKYLCMTGLSAEEVARQFAEMNQKRQ